MPVYGFIIRPQVARDGGGTARGEEIQVAVRADDFWGACTELSNSHRAFTIVGYLGEVDDTITG